MKIAIGKIGKSIKFGPEEKGKGKKAMTAGSIDARIIFQTLIKFNPEHTFYLIGRSNYSRLKPEIRNEYLTDLLFLAQKKGNKVFDFGPFGKLY